MSGAGRAVFARIALQRGQLVLENQFGVVEQPPDQGRLAVIYGAAGGGNAGRTFLPGGRETR